MFEINFLLTIYVAGDAFLGGKIYSVVYYPTMILNNKLIINFLLTIRVVRDVFLSGKIDSLVYYPTRILSALRASSQIKT